MHDNSKRKSPAPQSRAQHEADAAAAATNTEARLAYQKVAELHHEKDRNLAASVNGIRRP